MATHVKHTPIVTLGLTIDAQMRIFISLCEHICGVLVLLMRRIHPAVARNTHTQTHTHTKVVHTHVCDYGTFAP